MQLRVGDPFPIIDTNQVKKLTAEQFKEYATDPLTTDDKVRKWCNLPEDRYFTVATWPEERAGEVRVTELHRVVRATKISKSTQGAACDGDSP